MENALPAERAERNAERAGGDIGACGKRIARAVAERGYRTAYVEQRIAQPEQEHRRQRKRTGEYTPGNKPTAEHGKRACVIQPVAKRSERRLQGKGQRIVKKDHERRGFRA